MTFDDWWKEMKPAECDELKDEFFDCWLIAEISHDAEVESLRQQLAERDKQVMLLRDALIYAKTQLPDIIDTRLIDEALAATEPKP